MITQMAIVYSIAVLFATVSATTKSYGAYYHSSSGLCSNGFSESATFVQSDSSLQSITLRCGKQTIHMGTYDNYFSGQKINDGFLHVNSNASEELTVSAHAQQGYVPVRISDFRMVNAIIKKESNGADRIVMMEFIMYPDGGRRVERFGKSFQVSTADCYPNRIVRIEVMNAPLKALKVTCQNKRIFNLPEGYSGPFSNTYISTKGFPEAHAEMSPDENISSFRPLMPQYQETKKGMLPILNETMVKIIAVTTDSAIKIRMPGKNFIVPTFSNSFPYYSLSDQDDSSILNMHKNQVEEQKTGTQLIAPTSQNRLAAIISAVGQWFKSSQAEAVNTVNALVKSKRRKVVIVGVHGWFPTVRLVQTVFGERQGTSSKFCQEMEQIIKEQDAEAETVCIALNGDGKVQDRVDLYEGILLDPHNNYTQSLKEADEIYFVAHSQGCLVAASLISRLIKMSLIDCTAQKVGTLFMAGICHGPFRSIKGNLVIQYVETDAARELFDYCYGGESSSTSANSKDDDEEISFDVEMESVKIFWEDVQSILQSNVKICCVSSWLDPVVPLYSSLMYAFDHPNIFRCLYVDSYNFKNDFILQLISFAVKLRNFGLDDQRIIVDLSELLSGSMYQGVEHSTIFEEPSVYQTALNWFRHETHVSVTQRKFKLRPFRCTSKINSYRLPWSLRSLYAHEAVRNSQDLRQELIQLHKSLSSWSPSNRNMKIVKHRLLGLRDSKL